MLSQPVRLYLYASLAAFSICALKAREAHAQFYEFCAAMIEDQKSFLATMNALFLLMIYASYKIIKFTFGKFSQMAMEHSLGQMLTIALSMLTNFIANDQSDEKADLFSVAIPSCSLLLILIFILTTLDEFPVQGELPSAKTHKRIVTLQIFLFYLSVYLLIHSIESKGGIIVIRMYGHCILKSLLGISRHIVLLADRKNFGNSIKSLMINQLLDLIADGLDVIVEVSFVLYEILSSWNVNYQIIVTIIQYWKNLFQSAKKLITSRRLFEQVDHLLPNATQEDLERDSICINCRNQMIVGDCKRLPCGHCLHFDCLQRYIMSKDTCPLCQRKIIEGRSDNVEVVPGEWEEDVEEENDEEEETSVHEGPGNEEEHPKNE